MKDAGHNRSVRRALAVAVASLLFGVLATAAAAWLAAATSEMERYQGESHRPARPSDLPAYLRPIWPPPVRVSHRHLDGLAVTNTEIRCCEDPNVFDREHEWAKGVPTPPRPGLMRHSFGWPMRAMYYDHALHSGGRLSKAELQEFFDQFTAAAGFRNGKRFPDWVPVARGSFRAMPRAVLPLGFAIDTLVFAGLFALLVRGPGVLRRWRRRRRGLCVRCGYSRTGLAEGGVCPECGTTAGGAGKRSDLP